MPMKYMVTCPNCGTITQINCNLLASYLWISPQLLVWPCPACTHTYSCIPSVAMCVGAEGEEFEEDDLDDFTFIPENGV